jgi:hypothetical protein
MFKLPAISQKHDNILTFNFLHVEFFDVEEPPAG